MSVRMPQEVRTEIRELVYQRLDAVNYLAQGRVENGRFMEQLARDPMVGARIAEYTGKERVKTYIKDAVINRYAKERTKPPSDLSKTVAGVVGEKCFQGRCRWFQGNQSVSWWRDTGCGELREIAEVGDRAAKTPRIHGKKQGPAGTQ